MEGIRLGPTAWCTEAGSIFSIDEVITEAALPSWFEQTLGMVICVIFFQYPYLTAIVMLGLVGLFGFLIMHSVRRRRNAQE